MLFLINRRLSKALIAEAVGEAVYSACFFAGMRFIFAFKFMRAGRYPEPNAVNAADFRVSYTTNDKSIRPMPEALIRAIGGTPSFEGG